MLALNDWWSLPHQTEIPPRFIEQDIGVKVFHSCGFPGLSGMPVALLAGRTCSPSGSASSC